VLTSKGHAAVALIRVRDGWADLSPSQQAECAELLERLSMAMRREHCVATHAPSSARVPLVGRIAS